MTVLSYDAESFNRGITSHPLTDEILHEIRTDLDKTFIALLSDKKDVVLDYSFWSKDMRARYILCLKIFDIDPTIYYVKTPKHICMERIHNRKGNHANDILLTPETASQYYDQFQPPTADEGHIIEVKGY